MSEKKSGESFVGAASKFAHLLAAVAAICASIRAATPHLSSREVAFVGNSSD